MIKILFFKNKEDEKRHYESGTYVNYKHLCISYPERKGRQGDIFKINEDYFMLIGVQKTNDMDYFREGYSSIDEYRCHKGDLDRLFTHCFIKINENLDNEYLSQDSRIDYANRFPSVNELKNAICILNTFVMNTPPSFDNKRIEALCTLEESVKNYIYK